MSEYVSIEHGYTLIRESTFGRTDYDAMIKIIEVFKPLDVIVVHCPGLAHKVESLSKLGSIIWMDRDRKNILTSMVNNEFQELAWTWLQLFKQEYPEDPVFDVEYDPAADSKYCYTGIVNLLIKIKDHAYNTYFRDKCKLEYLENQTFFNPDKQKAMTYPLPEKLLGALDG